MIHPVARLFSALLLSSAFLTAQTRPLRVALYDFDQASVAQNIQKELGHAQNYGKIASDLLLPRLISGNAEVISRDQIERLLKEQNLKYSDRFDPTQAAQYGKLLGVDAIITGTIDSLYIEQTKKSIIVRQKVSIVAHVEATAKLISTATGKVLAAPSYKGKFEKDMGTSYLGPIGNDRNRNQQQQQQGGNAGGETGTRQGADPYVREALRECIQQIGKDLVTHFPNLQQIDITRRTPAPKPPARETELSSTKNTPAPPDPSGYLALDDEIGVVIKTADKSVVFTLSGEQRIKPGDTVEVQRAEIITNPRTQKKVAVGEKVGVLEITEVKTAYIRGELKTGTAAMHDRIVAAKAAPIKRPAAPPAKKSTTTKSSPAGQAK